MKSKSEAKAFKVVIAYYFPLPSSIKFPSFVAPCIKILYETLPTCS